MHAMHAKCCTRTDDGTHRRDAISACLRRAPTPASVGSSNQFDDRQQHRVSEDSSPARALWIKVASHRQKVHNYYRREFLAVHTQPPRDSALGTLTQACRTSKLTAGINLNLNMNLLPANTEAVLWFALLAESHIGVDNL